MDLVCKKQALIRGRGVSHCKNLLSPRFESSDGSVSVTRRYFTLRLNRSLPAKLGRMFMFLRRRLQIFDTSHVSSGTAGNSEEPLDKTYYVMLPPELCLVHPLPGPLVRGAQRLPSVMRRVESMLLAVQLKHQIAYKIPASKVR